jgi:hypothetical protein
VGSRGCIHYLRSLVGRGLNCPLRDHHLIYRIVRLAKQYGSRGVGTCDEIQSDLELAAQRRMRLRLKVSFATTWLELTRTSCKVTCIGDLSLMQPPLFLYAKIQQRGSRH